MSDGNLQAYVLCSDAASAKRWQALAASYSDLDVKPTVTHSALETIRHVAASASGPFLVCAETVWLGLGLAHQVRLLREELDARYPNWALCGNRGVHWDGRRIYDYSYDMNSGGLQTSVCAHAVISVDDSLLLVNAAVLNAHRTLAPPIKHRRPGILLSLECLHNGSVIAVSPRLLAMRDTLPDGDVEDAPDADPEFRDYYRSWFVNHHLTTPDGTLDLSEVVDYSYVADPRVKPPQQDILRLYDHALEISRGGARPSLTICCRTQFRRPELLERAVLSFAALRQHALPLADVVVRLITDVPSEEAEPEVLRLQEAYPGAALECWHHAIRPNRYSRTDLLLAAIERAATDYIWFIDDDDFVNAAAGPALARSLVAGAPVVVVASASKIQEKWQAPGTGGPIQLVRAETAAPYHATHVFRVLRGLNMVPICSMILPVPLMKQRIGQVCALGDYNEDYFLLLLALTSARVEVSLLDCEISSVSIRGTENTVTQKDRSGWHLSLATFLLEIMNNGEGNSPFLWQLSNAPRW